MKQQYTEEGLEPMLNQLMENKESGIVEFKSAKGGFPGSFWQTYSSFANTHGGVIILGVKEKDGLFTLDGLTQEQIVKYRKDFFDSAHNSNKINRCIISEEDVQEVEFNGMYVLFFYIPQVNVSLRPIYCGTDPYKGTYRRDWEGDYFCSPEEVSSMYADANLSQSRDARIIENFGIDDLDMSSVKQYRILFDKANPDHVWSSLETEDFLKKINVLRSDRKTKQEGVTIAGLLMFGTYSSLTEALPNFFPDYQEKQTDGNRWINRICPDGNWESNLFQFYRKILPILQGFLPKPFKLEDNMRQGETSAHVAVREAFTNCLVHADYSINASLNVYKFPNYILFSNPGTLLISIKQYYKGGESVCRNKLLQTMFTFLGSAEKAGSGTDKIMHGWDEHNWKRPSLCEKSHPNKVELTMVMESLLDENIENELRRIYGEVYDHLESFEKMTLSLALTEESINNERLHNALGMHRSDITDMLGKMSMKGLLQPHGYGRGRTYCIASSEANMASNMASSEANMASNMASSEANMASNMASSEANMASSKKRYSKGELKEKLIEICDDWRDKEYIAQALGRDVKYVNNYILPNNLDVLERRFEDIPKHPAQKYRARKNN